MGQSWNKGYSPMFKYEWEPTYESLLKYAACTDGSPFDGVLMEYVNPVTNGPVMPTMGASMQMLRPGEHTKAHRHTGSYLYHVAKGKDCTVGCIAVPRAEASAFGVMAVDAKHMITDFVEKPADPPAIEGKPDRSLCSMGVYIFNAKYLYDELQRDANDQTSSHDFARDIIPRAVKTGCAMAHSFSRSCVHVADEKPGKEHYWRDVGNIDAYWETNIDLAATDPALILHDTNWPIWTYQEQLPPAKFVFDDDDRRGTAIDSLVAGGCIISGATVKRSLLFSSVYVHSWAQVEDSVILPGADIGRHAVLKRCVVDKQCRIPEGMVIGVDPEADRKRFHVSPKGITLVTAEMLGQGAAEKI